MSTTDGSVRAPCLFLVPATLVRFLNNYSFYLVQGEPLYCICKTPYDPNRFYIGCDNCDNWFHGECVNINQEVGDTIGLIF
ncbi:hypothetical protein BKA69DRAFT_1029545 [Paraphysoderma sedebokerense]|nr:hypothetical protein BKA69DRAFT_1029545 [Paraphysoderma sedebokerense]